MEYCDFPIHAWSRYRHHLRQQCPRKARLCCCECRNGADREAEKQFRLLHDLRRRIPMHSYLQRLFTQALRELFYQESAEDDMMPVATCEVLAELIHRRFDREVELMLCGVAAQDHKFFLIKELENKNCNISSLISEADKKIDQLCQALKKELWKLISSTGVISRRNIASPLALNINELRCYCAPLFALEKNGEFWIVENNCDDRIALLHKFYAVNTLNREPHLVRSFSYEPESGELREAGLDLAVSRLLEEISADSAYWAELTALPLEDVPVNTEHCQKCEFSFFCNDYYPKMQLNKK